MGFLIEATNMPHRQGGFSFFGVYIFLRTCHSPRRIHQYHIFLLRYSFCWRQSGRLPLLTLTVKIRVYPPNPLHPRSIKNLWLRDYIKKG